jgi:LysR family glycine cleavage system transcriptional activator
LTWAGEQLFPVVRDGFESFARAIHGVRAGGSGDRLRVTATNAFAARWLVPRLPKWREAHPRLKLDILGTDEVLSLKTSEADVAIRYARRAPTDGPSFELARDRFLVVASPRLVGQLRRALNPTELARFPLIEAEWPAGDAGAPTWQRWQSVVRKRHKHVPDLSDLVSLNFREELHAIEAAISGQGIAICSNVLVSSELASGALVKVANATLPGYGFYIMHRAGHPKLAAINAFVAWAKAAS